MKSETKTVVCKDCGVTFDVVAQEQDWYAERGWDLPKRCPKCRAANRAKRRISKEEK